MKRFPRDISFPQPKRPGPPHKLSTSFIEDLARRSQRARSGTRRAARPPPDRSTLPISPFVFPPTRGPPVRPPLPPGRAGFSFCALEGRAVQSSSVPRVSRRRDELHSVPKTRMLGPLSPHLPGQRGARQTHRGPHSRRRPRRGTRGTPVGRQEGARLSRRLPSKRADSRRSNAPMPRTGSCRAARNPV